MVQMVHFAIIYCANSEYGAFCGIFLHYGGLWYILVFNGAYGACRAIWCIMWFLMYYGALVCIMGLYGALYNNYEAL